MLGTLRFCGSCQWWLLNIYRQLKHNDLATAMWHGDVELWHRCKCTRQTFGRQCFPLRKLDVIIGRFPRGFLSAADWDPLFFSLKKKKKNLREIFNTSLTGVFELAAWLRDFISVERTRWPTFFLVSFFLLFGQSSLPGPRHVAARWAVTHQSQTRGKLGQCKTAIIATTVTT